jgi:hypothetical protein
VAPKQKKNCIDLTIRNVPPYSEREEEIYRFATDHHLAAFFLSMQSVGLMSCQGGVIVRSLQLITPGVVYRRREKGPTDSEVLESGVSKVKGFAANTGTVFAVFVCSVRRPVVDAWSCSKARSQGQEEVVLAAQHVAVYEQGQEEVALAAQHVAVYDGGRERGYIDCVVNSKGRSGTICWGLRYTDK